MNHSYKMKIVKIKVILVHQSELVFTSYKNQKEKERKLFEWNYNHFHNTLRLFDVLPNFHFTKSETIHDYYLWIWYILVASRVAKQFKKSLECRS